MNLNIVLMRNFLFKWFVVGFVILVISAVLFIFLKDVGAQMASRFYGVDPAFYINFAFTMLGIVKIFLIFFILSPALALHWITKCKKEG